MQAANYCTSSTKTTTTGKIGPHVNVRIQLHEPVEYGADKSYYCLFAKKKRHDNIHKCKAQGWQKLTTNEPNSKPTIRIPSHPKFVITVTQTKSKSDISWRWLRYTKESSIWCCLEIVTKQSHSHRFRIRRKIRSPILSGNRARPQRPDSFSKALINTLTTCTLE